MWLCASWDDVVLPWNIELKMVLMCWKTNNRSPFAHIELELNFNSRKRPDCSVWCYNLIKWLIKEQQTNLPTCAVCPRILHREAASSNPSPEAKISFLCQLQFVVWVGLLTARTLRVLKLPLVVHEGAKSSFWTKWCFEMQCLATIQDSAPLPWVFRLQWCLEGRCAIASEQCFWSLLI